jgi:hypothetical protein
MYTFLYSVKKRFSFNNVSTFVLVKMKQICSKLPNSQKLFQQCCSFIQNKRQQDHDLTLF